MGHGTAEFDLKNGDVAGFADIPGECQYQVSEDGTEDYIASYEIGDISKLPETIQTMARNIAERNDMSPSSFIAPSSVMPSKGNTEPNQSLSTSKETMDLVSGNSGENEPEFAVVTFTNTFNVTELSVTKKIAGNMGDKSKQFRFELKLKGDKVPDNLTVTKDGKGTVAAGKNGVFAFTLSHDETAVIKDIPIGLTYSVSEPDAEKDGYKATTEGKVSGTLTDAVSMTFTNTKNVGIPTSAYDSTAKIGIMMSLIGAAILCITEILLKKNRKEKI